MFCSSREKEVASDREVTQSVVSEDSLPVSMMPAAIKHKQRFGTAQETKQSEEERLKLEARETKVIPVKVTLNADQLNSVEVRCRLWYVTGCSFTWAISPCNCKPNVVTLLMPT